MKHVITNYRYWVLTLLSFTVIIGTVAVPQDTLPTLAYVVILLGSKLIALTAAAAFCQLYIHWHDKGQLAELSNLAKEE